MIVESYGEASIIDGVPLPPLLLAPAVAVGVNVLAGSIISDSLIEFGCNLCFKFLIDVDDIDVDVDDDDDVVSLCNITDALNIIMTLNMIKYFMQYLLLYDFLLLA